MAQVPKGKIKRNSVFNQKLKRNLNNIIHDIANLGTFGELPIDNYLSAIKISPKDRKTKDLAIIKNFLENSELAQKFKSDNFNK